MNPFDPELFMNTSFDQESATRVMPCPVGEYTAQVKDVKTRVLGNGSVVMDVTWVIDDANARQITGRKEITSRQSVWLDFDEGGNLAFGEGKNVGLGRLRKALNQNKAGQPWSPSMLKGGVAKVKVAHTPSKDNPEDMYDNVVAVAALS